MVQFSKSGTAVVLSWLVSEIVSHGEAVHALKGVSPEGLLKYQPQEGNKFHCFSDPSKVFDFSVVNDDYCDCEDGSDEPGTSACPNSQFFCNNTGYKAKYIFSSRVNDSICDCCDGSDEYDGTTTCPNTCGDLAQVERAEEERLANIFSQGSSIRQKYIQQYAALKEKALQEAEVLSKKVEEAKAKVEELRKVRDDLEKQEEEAKTNQETQETSKPSPNPEYENKLEDLKEVASTLQDDIKHLQSILEDLKQNHNQNYHDMAVKGAITAYDEFVENYNEVDFHTDTRFQVDKTEETVNQGPSEGETNYDPSTVGFEPLQWIRDSVTKLSHRVFHYASHLLTRAPLDVTQARNQFWDAESALRNSESDLEKATKTANMDYGPDGSFAALNEKCIELPLGEYTYSVCMFGEVHQKSSREEIFLGKFSQWEGSNYGAQLYSGGTYCWNGPQRSAKVFFECGTEEKLLDVIEPEKCVYHIQMSTPAACFHYIPPPIVASPPPAVDDEKDEL